MSVKGCLGCTRLNCETVTDGNGTFQDSYSCDVIENSDEEYDDETVQATINSMEESGHNCAMYDEMVEPIDIEGGKLTRVFGTTEDYFAEEDDD